jgi:predicted CXXCH cytochrome family protein
MTASVLIVLILAGQPQGASSPGTEASPTPDECLACHADPVELTLADGRTHTLRIDHAALEKSVHAGKATCADCHPQSREVPHPERQFTSARQLSVAASEGCRQCHFTDYRRTLDSVHADAVARGDRMAPVCVDCHGGHDVQSPNVPRTRVADTCAKCHAGVAQTYAASVHGQDVARNIVDVPTCTDCHQTHDIAGPRQAGWRSSTPQICGRCHGDESRMEKYGLSTRVLTTYVADFHGKTASLRRATGGTRPEPFVAVCSDCHGTHDVGRADAAASPVLKANLAKTCRQCHEGASAQFPDSWLSHYEPSLSHAPAVYAVRLGYRFLIPFVIGGLVLQILLHLWRVAVNR